MVCYAAKSTLLFVVSKHGIDVEHIRCFRNTLCITHCPCSLSLSLSARTPRPTSSARPSLPRCQPGPLTLRCQLRADAPRRRLFARAFTIFCAQRGAGSDTAFVHAGAGTLPGVLKMHAAQCSLNEFFLCQSRLPSVI